MFTGGTISILTHGHLVSFEGFFRFLPQPRVPPRRYGLEEFQGGRRPDDGAGSRDTPQRSCFSEPRDSKDPGPRDLGKGKQARPRVFES